MQGDEDDEPEKCKKCITGFALNLEKNFCYDVLGENQSFCIEMTGINCNECESSYAMVTDELLDGRKIKVCKENIIKQCIEPATNNNSEFQ